MSAPTLLAAVVAALVGTYAATLPAGDPDLFWHLASGGWMLDRRELLTRDVFSYTMTGSPYSVGQWLGQVLYAGVFRWAGWSGIDLLRGLLLGTAAFFVSRVTLRVQPHPGWAIVPILAAVLVSRPFWGDRPQLFSLALFPVFLDVLLGVRSGASPRRAWALVPLAWLWAQLHGAFVLGVVLLPIFAAEAWLSRSDRRRPLLAASIAALVATQLTPSGPGAFAFAASYATTASAVLEERPATIDSASGALFVALLLVALSAALLAERRALGDALSAPLILPGGPLIWALLVPPFAVNGMLHQRNLPYAAAVLAPIVAALVPLALRRPPYAAPLVPRPAGAAVASAVVAIAVVVASLTAPPAPDLAAYPVGAVALLRDRPGNLFHEYDWGGYLIFALPEHPTYVDGRGAALFPASLIREFEGTVALRPGYRDVLAQRQIRFMLVRPDRPLAVAVEDDGWRVLGREGSRWVLLERP